MPQISDLLILAGVAMLAGFVQGLSGFGFGIVAMSIWAWVFEPHLAAIMTVFGALIGQLFSFITMRTHISMKVVLPFLLGGAVGVPLGVVALPRIDATVFKAIVGVTLLIWCSVMLLSKRLPRVKKTHPIADGLVGVVGGFMSGLGGLPGVAPTLWGALRGFDKYLQRSIIQHFNLSTLATAMGAFIINGSITSDMYPRFAVVAPALLLPSFIGGKIFVGLSEMAFRRVVLTLLTVSGGLLLFSSVPALLRG